MKKSIILLISLFFIAAFSALILKNLDDTNSYLDEQNSKFNKVQTLILIKDLQEQISEILKNYGEKVDLMIDSDLVEYFPLKIQNINLFFKILPYEKIDINKLLSKDVNDLKELKLFFEENDIYNIETLQDLIKQKEKIISNKQLDDIIDTFTKETYDKRILNSKDKIGFLSDEKLYELFIKVNFIKEFVKAYYVLNKQGEIKYFELSFK
jgi:hypothetical protein